eukprot:CAMPEP_0178388474 /NCGR_PEP_ID=MMETSP0689_2-20121128/9613_1 /TAXON_ID=160604 /ORGANISM="Amphidinium massartii, Strain CS-259" /LENGTH=99 /DNA_ID=CAMNT_0020008881 /DNA_START=290 /DNA_END=589 /DNA_ORIENTATION=-
MFACTFSAKIFGAPNSLLKAVATFPLTFMYSAKIPETHFLRSAKGFRDHAGKAEAAASIALSVSAAVPLTILAHTSPLLESTTSRYSVEPAESTQAPLM